MLSAVFAIDALRVNAYYADKSRHFLEEKINKPAKQIKRWLLIKFWIWKREKTQDSSVYAPESLLVNDLFSAEYQNHKHLQTVQIRGDGP